MRWPTRAQRRHPFVLSARPPGHRMTRASAGSHPMTEGRTARPRRDARGAGGGCCPEVCDPSGERNVVKPAPTADLGESIRVERHPRLHLGARRPGASDRAQTTRPGQSHGLSTSLYWASVFEGGSARAQCADTGRDGSPPARPVILSDASAGFHFPEVGTAAERAGFEEVARQGESSPRRHGIATSMRCWPGPDRPGDRGGLEAYHISAPIRGDHEGWSGGVVIDWRGGRPHTGPGLAAANRHPSRGRSAILRRCRRCVTAAAFKPLRLSSPDG